MPPTPSETLMDYHEATKHHFHRYARSAGAMDWANQPNPFRFYDGADQIPLPLAHKDPGRSYDALYTAPAGEPAPLDFAAVGLFLEFSLGLSAWKAAGKSRWSLRINPSSGNLHPTEGHLVLPDIPGLAGGVFHYSPLRHGLERRLHLPNGCWPQLSEHFKGPGFLAALSTIFWRESWKYGERAYRYCNLDVGHALAAISFAARLQGWKAVCLTGAGDDQIRALLGFTGQTWPPGGAEEPELLCWIATAPRPGHDPQQLPKQWERFFLGQSFTGRPNPLSPAMWHGPLSMRPPWRAKRPRPHPAAYPPNLPCQLVPLRRNRLPIRLQQSCGGAAVPCASIPASLFQRPLFFPS
jgi:SagB-type dehydrogenase family enzyme